MLRRALLIVTLGLLAGLTPVLLYAGAVYASVPADFEDRLVTALEGPTALAFTPDGRMLVTGKQGQLRVYKDGTLLGAPALDISGKVCPTSERGLLGVAVDPNFAANHYIYLYYTYKKYGVCPTGQPTSTNNPVNRVSRFVLRDDNTVDPANEMLLIDNIPSPNGNHNGGDLQFGKDGYLYVSVGDGGCDYAQPTKCQNENDAARDRNVLLGKILRITREGDIPPGNPFTGQNSARCNQFGRTTAMHCQETFAWGLRNPFRMAFDPDAAGTSFRINDVGGGVWEEIDRGQAGADYGWNVREGPCLTGSSKDCGAPAAGMTNPIHYYNHNTGCASITGGAFVPNSASWPASFNGAYLFGDYVCGKIFSLTPTSSGFTRTEFAAGLGGGGPVAMAFGPYKDGEALYYTTFANGGEVRRIVYTAGNKEPVADIKGSQLWNPGLTISFDASYDGSAGSYDPDGDTPLTYTWDFGDGTREVTTTDPTTSHTYQTSGKYIATLTVRDSKGAVSDPDRIEVFPGDTPPEPTIESPSSGTLFRVGQSITLRGSATDAEDDADGNPATGPVLRWEVRRHHNNNHYHPYYSGTGGQLAFPAPAPEGIEATNPVGNYLEVRLTATDSSGLSKTVTRRLEPRTVEVRFGSDPRGLKLKVAGVTFRAPRTFVSWEGYKLNVYAPSQRHDGKRWRFRSWSDHKGKSHTITTPSTPTTYIATFKERH